MYNEPFEGLALEIQNAVQFPRIVLNIELPSS